jgi:serine/threonine protein kinase
VLITEEGRGVICDFGLVHLFQEEMNTGMTTTTAHTGTTRYLAYELIRNMGQAEPSTASDIYALGCLGLEVSHSNLSPTYCPITCLIVVYLSISTSRNARRPIL